MRKIVFFNFLFITLLLSTLRAQNMITSYSVQESDEGVSIILEFSEGVPQYRDFTLANPPRIVVDLINVGYSLGGKLFVVGKGGVERIRGAQYQREPELVARIVLDVDEFRSYSIVTSEKSLIIKVGGISSVPYSSSAPGEAAPAPTEKTTTVKTEEKQYKLEVGEKYFYSSRGKKDPFKPEAFGEEEELLNVSEAKLLGIIKSDEGNVALLQDRRGVGYVLKEGDRVRNGRVVKIESDRVVFAIVDFGFTRRVELKLEEENK
ncbi:MAG: AMIN domain-containing protein [Candidatus Hydrothermia bacterium]